mmetsp:Transcript_9985/g.17618  ORF Transcript_9985/g.17618 Transcript_9985/m.17618 type:complete len:239 (+) Transcript_9985:1641-2357(+)
MSKAAKKLWQLFASIAATASAVATAILTTPLQTGIPGPTNALANHALERRPSTSSGSPLSRAASQPGAAEPHILNCCVNKLTQGSSCSLFMSLACSTTSKSTFAVSRHRPSSAGGLFSPAGVSASAEVSEVDATVAKALHSCPANPSKNFSVTGEKTTACLCSCSLMLCISSFNEDANCDCRLCFIRCCNCSPLTTAACVVVRYSAGKGGAGKSCASLFERCNLGAFGISARLLACAQ